MYYVLGPTHAMLLLPSYQSFEEVIVTPTNEEMKLRKVK